MGEDVVAQDFYLKAAGTAYAAAQLVPLPTKEASAAPAPALAAHRVAGAVVSRAQVGGAASSQSEDLRFFAQRLRRQKVLDTFDGVQSSIRTG